MIFQYCRSTLSPIFTADYISLLPYPNLRDHFGTAAAAARSRARSDLREEKLSSGTDRPPRAFGAIDEEKRQEKERWTRKSERAAEWERGGEARSGELH